MQFDQLKRREFVTLLGRVAAGCAGAAARRDAAALDLAIPESFLLRADEVTE
jgi:hypothetical protein